MFSQASVCTQGEGEVTSNASWDRSDGRGPLSPLFFSLSIPPNMGPRYLPPPLLTFGGHHWRPVQTGSLEDLPPTLVLDI